MSWTLWRNLSLRVKIGLLTSVLVVATVLALTALSIRREQENFQQALLSQASLFLQTIGFTLRDPLYQLQMDELLDIARIVGENPSINDLIVYDAAGKILVDSSEPRPVFAQEVDALGARLVQLPANEVLMIWEPTQLVAGRAIVVGNQVIGAVAAGLSTQALEAKLLAITQESIGLALLSLLAAGVFTWSFANGITRPLRALTTVATKMKDGDLSIRVGPESVSLRAQDEIGQLGAAFNQMAVGLQEREWLRDLFGRFVSPDVAEGIRTGQVKLEGENRLVSVLFCDIREFTEFAGRHSPHEVVALLNDYLAVVVKAAYQYGGLVNKFGGDSSLIIYGALYDVENSAYQAVQTALAIHAGVQTLNATLGRRGEPPLRIGVGINTGMALAGAVGPRERQEYTVIGNSVNLAARIDALNKQFPEHEILISGWTYAALGLHQREFALRSLGQVAIRGAREPVAIWAVQPLPPK